MTRFQDLLTITHDASSTPRADQERASRQLPDVVKSSRLCWWSGPPETPPEPSFLLLVVAPYSHYDLALLDILDEEMTRRRAPDDSRAFPVYVANLQHYHTAEQLTKDISIITRAPLQTPLVAVWEAGGWRKSATGKRGRDLVAATLGISPEDFNETVIARVPKYAPSA